MEFVIKIIDFFGNQCYLEIDDIKVIVCSLVRKEIDIKVDDLYLSGKYSVMFILECDGEYKVLILVNDQLFFCSLWNVSVGLYKYIFFFNFVLLRKGRKFKEFCVFVIDNEIKRIVIVD